VFQSRQNETRDPDGIRVISQFLPKNQLKKRKS